MDSNFFLILERKSWLTYVPSKGFRVGSHILCLQSLQRLLSVAIYPRSCIVLVLLVARNCLIHVVLGQPRGLVLLVLPCSIIFGHLSLFILWTWPNHLLWMSWILSTMVCCIPVVSLMISFGILSVHDMLQILLRHLFSKASIFCSSFFLIIHVSAPYSAVGITIDFNSLILSLSDIFWSFQIFLSLPNDIYPKNNLSCILFSVPPYEVKFTPRYLNLSTCSMVLSPIRKSTTSVCLSIFILCFSVLIFILCLLHCTSILSIILIRSSMVCYNNYIIRIS